MLFVFVGRFVLLVLLPSALVVAFEFGSGVFFLLFLKQALLLGIYPFIAFAPPHFSTHTRWKIKHWVRLFFFFFAPVSVAAYMKNQALVNTCSGSC